MKELYSDVRIRCTNVQLICYYIYDIYTAKVRNIGKEIISCNIDDWIIPKTFPLVHTLASCFFVFIVNKITRPETFMAIEHNEDYSGDSCIEDHILALFPKQSNEGAQNKSWYKHRHDVLKKLRKKIITKYSILV